MSKRKSIDEFVSQKNVAIVGVSRNEKKFGNYICKELNKKGYIMYPVHPTLEVVNDVKCYESFDKLPDDVDSVILNVPPYKAKEAVKEVAEKGFKRVWIQQGASSPEVIQECESNKIDYVNNECIIMYTEPVESFHKIHRFIWKLIGKYQK
jgi:predicted CoA-binding protein